MRAQKKRLHAMGGAVAPSSHRVTKPGHGIYRDGQKPSIDGWVRQYLRHVADELEAEVTVKALKQGF